ncbi:MULTISPECIES: DUF3313 domain-containing protein [unclassified Pseudomonas]|uniref:DUF3313 domain-containing protein n=1 Tax=unclassified Pseudomonas TaxID=196821 RepID=UPI002446A55B|nr:MULTISPECIES: DUF3313 domain-containing protein [unclassified Pseudomonas]MDH0300897.1 DUF3313 domain-containing protein [Pseudomonas sp. GD04091]MDH1985194.1 DUF3313 domain-containing protein [Pseudomonas sp. GD03689]
MSRRHAIALLFSGALGLAGCSGNQLPPAGYLTDYSVLAPHPSPSSGTLLSWVDPKLPRGRYIQVYVAPSRFYPAPAPSTRIPQDTLDQITRYYDSALRQELGKVMTVVDAPGPNTLVVRPAITRVSANTQGLRFYEWLPITLVAAGVSSAVGVRDRDSQIATELSFEAGTSGKVIAEAMLAGTGTPLENDRQVMTAENVKAVLDGWASDLRQLYAANHR